MWLLFPRTLTAVALTLAAPAGPSRTWIASLKANSAAVANRTFEIEGEVVDIRSTSPIGHRGFYRLVDTSDTAGVLVQTEDLPSNGGAFRVLAKVAPPQAGGNPLLLVEIRRTATDGRPRVPLVALILSSLLVLVLAVLSGQAVREQRRYLLSLPLWLLPYAAAAGKTDTTRSDALPALRHEPEIETEDRRRHVRLRNRKRALLTGLGAAAALTGLSALWVAATEFTAQMVPAFIFLHGDDATPPATTPRGGSSIGPTSIGDEAPTGRIHPPESRRPTAAVLKPVGRDSGPIRRSSPVTAPPASVAESVPRLPPATVPPPSVTAAAPAVVVPTAPARNPTPPPPPPPAVARPPARSPASDRAEVSSALQEGAARLVAAINGKRYSDVVQLLPEGQAGDLSRRTRFLKLIKDAGPRAALGTMEEPTLAGDRGEARFSLSLSWRGDFGVTIRKTGGFLGVVRRQEGGWQFEGAGLRDNLP